MKRMLWSLAVVALAGSVSRADWGGFGPPIPQPGQQPVQPIRGEFAAPNTLTGMAFSHSNKAPDRYGLMPGLRRAFRLDNSGGCSTCGTNGKPGLFSNGGGCANGNCGHGGGGYPGYEYPQYPPPMQGTLVFPQHQFIRSPRDFFMYEPGR
jgi:hypothetical protein